MKREADLNRYTGAAIKKHHPEYLFYSNFLPPLTNAIQKYGKGKVLDIGCGNKPYQNYFGSSIDSYLGCDVIQSSNNSVDVLCEATSIPLESNSFHTIISTQVIEHVAEPQQMVNEAFRLLAAGGHFIVSSNMYWPLHEEPYDFFRFTKHGFRHLMEKSGFEVIEIVPNGGKWAVFGQVFFLTVPWWLVMPKFIKWILNSIFTGLDKRYFDDRSTINYVVVGRKNS